MQFELQIVTLQVGSDPSSLVFVLTSRHSFRKAKACSPLDCRQLHLPTTSTKSSRDTMHACINTRSRNHTSMSARVVESEREKRMTKHSDPPSTVRRGSAAVIGPWILALGNLYCFCCVQTNLHSSTGLFPSIALDHPVIPWSTGNCSQLLNTSLGADICIQRQSVLASVRCRPCIVPRHDRVQVRDVLSLDFAADGVPRS